MDGITSNPTVNSNLSSFVEPAKDPLLQRIVQVIKNTFFEMFKYASATFAAFAATYTAISSGCLPLIAIPVFWVAYCVFDAVKLLEEQEKIPVYEQALVFLTKVKADFDHEKLEDLIKSSSNKEELKVNLKNVQETIKKYRDRTDLSKFCKAFKMFDIASNNFLGSNVLDRENLECQKDLFCELDLKAIREHFDHELKLLPGYIERLKVNFYEGII